MRYFVSFGFLSLEIKKKLKVNYFRVYSFRVLVRYCLFFIVDKNIF